MKELKQHILEKLKVTSSLKINDKQFFDAVFNYCKRNDTPEIIAQNIYGELDNIPEICIDETGGRDKVNFALRPQGINKIIGLEIWKYTLKNEPIYMLIGVKADSYGFNLLNTDVFDEKIILDIYNYCV